MFRDIIKIKELKLYDAIDKRGEKASKEARKAKFWLIRPLKQLYNIIVYIKGLIAQIAH